jgi:hypothetical protein
MGDDETDTRHQPTDVPRAGRRSARTNLPAVVPPPRRTAPDVTMAEMVAHYRAGNSAVLRAVNLLGSKVEKGLNSLPASLRKPMEETVAEALRRAYDLTAGTTTKGAVRHWSERDRVHKSIAVLSGAVGGFFGPVGLAELPFSIATILRSIRSVAREYGYDPDDPQIAAECIAVFSAGGPLADDDGVNSAFLTARMAMNGARLERLIPRVAVRLTQVMGQKIGTQAVPVLGALGGATVNYAFMNFYTEMAHVYFGLKRMSEERDPASVLSEFRRAVGR